MREGPCNKGRMLKKFPTKFKYSIAIYTLNVYKTSTKKTSINSQLTTKQNIHFENQALPILKIRPPYITLLQKTKNVKIIKQDFSDFLSNQYKIMMTDCRILYRNEETLS